MVREAIMAVDSGKDCESETDRIEEKTVKVKQTIEEKTLKVKQTE